ncbi:hypothetical protein Peur_021016 [Populus x canadensis]
MVDPYTLGHITDAHMAAGTFVQPQIEKMAEYIHLPLEEVPVSTTSRALGRPYQAHIVYPTRVTPLSSIAQIPVSTTLRALGWPYQAHTVYPIQVIPISWIARVPVSTTSKSVETNPPTITPPTGPNGATHPCGV